MSFKLTNLLQGTDLDTKSELNDYCVHLLNDSYFNILINDYRKVLIHQTCYNTNDEKRKEYYYQLKGIEGFFNHINSIVEQNKRQ